MAGRTSEMDPFGVSKKMSRNKRAGLERAVNRKFALSGVRVRDKTYAKGALFLKDNPTKSKVMQQGHTMIRQTMKRTAGMPRLGKARLP